MSFLDDAKNFMEKKQSPKTISSTGSFLETPESRAAFEKELRDLYENATWTEINRAIDWGMEVLEKPYDKKVFLQKIRVKLED